MFVEVSIGEAIDKLNILEIKKQKILNETKQLEIKKEMDSLVKCNDIIQTHPEFYKWLTLVNTKIWELTDTVKGLNVTDPYFSIISNQIFEFNQKRFRIKSFFNYVTNSNLKEQKSYSSSHCLITISSIELLYDKIPEINYISTEYDYISFDIPNLEIVKNIFKQPNIIYENDESIPINAKIFLADFSINEDNKTNYANIPITYIAGGLLGDFIQSISVINENFLKTGKKGVLYIADSDDKFTKGLLNTYNDITEVISQQKYISRFEVYNDEPFDINLNNWRYSHLLYKANWYQLYKQTYNIEWGTHQWLTTSIDKKWGDKIIINTTSKRFPLNISFDSLFDISKNDIIFVSYDLSEYNFFIENAKINIPYYQSTSFTEICVIINSCKLFFGGLSSPLSIAHALHKPRIIGLGVDRYANIMIDKLDQIWSNVTIT